MSGPPTDGLVGYWNFDEGSGTTANDTSGNNNDGTLVSGPTWATGKIGSAISFDAVSSRVEIAHSSVFSFGEVSFSYSAWFYPRSYGEGGRGMILSKSGSDHNYYARINDSKASLYICSNGRCNTTWPTIANFLDQWHHLVVVDSVTSFTVYIDGEVYSTGGAFASDTSGVGTLYIGSVNGGTYVWDGLIDDVRFYNRALTSTEIGDIYNWTGGYSISLASGSYAVTGTAASGLLGRKLTAEAGSYTISGDTLSLLRSYLVAADAGEYTLTGDDLGFLRSYVATLEAGDYSIDGNNVTLSWSDSGVVARRLSSGFFPFCFVGKVRKT